MHQLQIPNAVATADGPDPVPTPAPIVYRTTPGRREDADPGLVPTPYPMRTDDLISASPLLEFRKEDGRVDYDSLYDFFYHAKRI